ncbi:MAG: hypothetical protein AAF591_10165 [Verrucomicrobiota bacterium]
MPIHSFPTAQRPSLRGRLFRRRRLTFLCPACERPIHVRKSGAGAELNCPLCHAAIVAPFPDANTPARIRDPLFEAARNAQRDRERQLNKENHDRFRTVLEKKQRRTQSPPNPQSIPQQNQPPVPSSHHQAPPFASALRDDALPGTHPSTPEPTAKNAVKVLTGKHLSQSFIPLDEVHILPSADGDPLAWDSPDSEREQSDTKRPVLTPLAAVQILAAAAAIVALLFLLAQRDMDNHREETERIASSKKAAKNRAVAAEQESSAHAAKVTAAVAAANEALAVRSWPELLPHVRHHRRLAPVMRQFYKNNPWQPRQITRVLSSESTTIEGHEFLSLTFEDQHSDILTLGLENTSDGWKIDWEQFVPLHEQEWHRFITERRNEPQTLRVSAIRRTPSPEQLALSRIPKDKAFGLMLWCTDVGRGTQLAILDRDSPIAKQLDALISVDNGKRMILTLSPIGTPKGMRDDLVSIDKLVNVGWTYTDDSPNLLPPSVPENLKNPKPAHDPYARTTAIHGFESLPARLGHPGNHPMTRQFPESNP